MNVINCRQVVIMRSNRMQILRWKSVGVVFWGPINDTTTIFLLEVWKSKLFAKIFFDLISRINWPKLRRIFPLKKRFSRLLAPTNSRLKKIGSGSGAALKIWLIRPSLASQHWSLAHIAGGRSFRWSTRTGRRPRRDWRTCSWPSQILRLPLGSTIGTVTFVFKKVMWYRYFSRWTFPF